MYCKEGNDLYNIKCAQCNNSFHDTVRKNKIVQSAANPVYVCLDQSKFKCRYAFCYMCYQSKSIDTEQTVNHR